MKNDRKKWYCLQRLGCLTKVHSISMIYVYYYLQTIFPEIKNKKIPHLMVTCFYHSFYSSVIRQPKDIKKKICNIFTYIIHSNTPQMCSIYPIKNSVLCLCFLGFTGLSQYRTLKFSITIYFIDSFT